MQTFIGPRISQAAPSMSREKLSLVSALLSLRNHRQQQPQRQQGAQDFDAKDAYLLGEQQYRFQAAEAEKNRRFLAEQQRQGRALDYRKAQIGAGTAQGQGQVLLQKALAEAQRDTDVAKATAAGGVREAQLEHTMGIPPMLYAGGQAGSRLLTFGEKMAGAGAGVREAEVKGQADIEKQKLIGGQRPDQQTMANQQTMASQLALHDLWMKQAAAADKEADDLIKQMQVEKLEAEAYAALQERAQRKRYEANEARARAARCVQTYQTASDLVARLQGLGGAGPDGPVGRAYTMDLSPFAARGDERAGLSPPPPAPVAAAPLDPRIGDPVAKLKAAGMQWIPVQVWEALRQDGFTDDEIREIDRHLRI